MEIFDLAIAYKWIYDKEFTSLIEQIFQKDGLKTFIIGEHNLYEISQRLKEKKLGFKAFFDRASDEDYNFVEITKILHRKKTHLFNPSHIVEKVIDKSIMHDVLQNAGIQVPYTVIIPPFEKRKTVSIPEKEFEKLGTPFIIKPAYYSGGGDSVNTNATTIADVINARMHYTDDSFLVQKKIYPKIIENRRAWFRPFYAFGHTIPTWWDDQTHLYSIMTQNDIRKYRLQKILTITKKIAELSRLDYFTTEIAQDGKGEFFVIDYVNDQCDMRLQHHHYDGVPEEIVVKFIEHMRDKVKAL